MSSKDGCKGGKLKPSQKKLSTFCMMLGIDLSAAKSTDIV